MRFWSRRWLEAQLGKAATVSERARAVEDYARRCEEMRDFVQRAEKEAIQPSLLSMQTLYDVADARVRVLESAGMTPVKRHEWIKANQARAEAVKRVYQEAWNLRETALYFEDLYVSSRDWALAELTTSDTSSGCVKAFAAHLSRMKEFRRFIDAWYARGTLPIRDLLASEYYEADAEWMLAEAREKK